MVKPRETVEVLEVVGVLFGCWYLVSLLSLFIMEYYFILCLELLQISTYVLMYLCTYVLMYLCEYYSISGVGIVVINLL